MSNSDPRPYPPISVALAIWGLGAGLYLIGFFQRVAPAVIPRARRPQRARLPELFVVCARHARAPLDAGRDPRGASLPQCVAELHWMRRDHRPDARVRRIVGRAVPGFTVRALHRAGCIPDLGDARRVGGWQPAFGRALRQAASQEAAHPRRRYARAAAVGCARLRARPALLAADHAHDWPRPGIRRSRDRVCVLQGIGAAGAGGNLIRCCQHGQHARRHGDAAADRLAARPGLGWVDGGRSARLWIFRLRRRIHLDGGVADRRLAAFACARETHAKQSA